MPHWNGGVRSPVAGETSLSETDMASSLNIGPVYIDAWRKGSLAKQGMIRRGIDVTQRPATTVAGTTVLQAQSDLSTFAASFAGEGRIGEQGCNAGLRRTNSSARRRRPSAGNWANSFLPVVPLRIFTASATAIYGRDGEKQVNVIRLVVACNCAKRELPRLKAQVSSEEFL
jgi:hypothetical protein